MLGFAHFSVYFDPDYSLFRRILLIEGIPFCEVEDPADANVIFGCKNSLQHLISVEAVVFIFDTSPVSSGCDILFSYESKFFRKKLILSRARCNDSILIKLNFDFRKLILSEKIVNTPIKIVSSIAYEPLVNKNYELYDTFASAIVHSVCLALYKEYRVLSRYPLGKQNVFCFRIDVDPDRSVRKSQAMERISCVGEHFEQYENFTSVALNLYRYNDDVKGLCDIFAGYHDIGSHGYFHHPYLSRQHCLYDLRDSIRLVNEAGVNCKGIIFPEYFYKINIEEELSEYGLDYMSSFGKSYSGQYQIGVNGIVDLPCCPLTLSRMESVGIKDMDGKLEVYIEQMTARVNNSVVPCIFYEHPQRMHTHLGLFDELFNVAKAYNLYMTSLDKFARWIKQRQHLVEAIGNGADIQPTNLSMAEICVQTVRLSAVVDEQSLGLDYFFRALNYSLKASDFLADGDCSTQIDVKMTPRYARKYLFAARNTWARF